MEKYKTLTELGVGSHAKVFLAEDPNGQKVALKAHIPNKENEDEIKTRFSWKPPL